MALPYLIKQLALRTSAIFIVKLIGFAARIPLYRMLGPEGIGKYQMVYSLYAVLLTLITGGFPTVLALTAANNQTQGWRLFKILSLLFIVLGFAASFVCYTFAPVLAAGFGDEGLTFAIRCTAITILLAPILSLVRGFLQGVEAYGHIAVSELIEQAVRVVTMLALVSFWINKGSGIAVSGTILGAFVGAGAAIIFLIAVLVRLPYPALQQRNIRGGLYISGNMSRLLQATLLISLSRFLVPLSEFLDVLIIPHRLQDAGFTFSQAASVFGEMSGMAATVTYMPLILTAALIHILFPRITADWHNKKTAQFARRVRSALDVGWLWGIGSALVLYFYNKELSIFIFGNDSAAIGIRYLAVSPLLASMRDLTTTVLWAADHKREPFTGMAVGLACSIVLNYYLVAIPDFQYAGIAIGYLSFEMISTLWNFAALKKCFGKSLVWNPLSFGVLMVVFMFVLGVYLSSAILGSVEVAGFLKRFVQMTVAYAFIALYILFRFLKKERA